MVVIHDLNQTLLLADLGSNKLENQHPYVPLNPLHFPQSPYMVILLVKGRIWKMDCFPRHFPDWLELPAALILLLVVAPGFFADTCIAGVAICLVIGCYLLQEHIRASGGFRNSFTKSNGISNSVGILLLFLYPVWAAITYVL